MVSAVPKLQQDPHTPWSLTGVTAPTNSLSRLMTKPTKWLCTQRRLRSAWASTQSVQSLRCPLNGYLRTQAFFMWTAKILIRLGGCPGWSESSLSTHAILLVLSWGGSFKALWSWYTYNSIFIWCHSPFCSREKQSVETFKDFIFLSSPEKSSPAWKPGISFHSYIYQFTKIRSNVSLFEPFHEIMVLFVLRKLIL